MIPQLKYEDLLAVRIALNILDENLAYKMEEKAVSKKRSVEETKLIPAMYDEEAFVASAELREECQDLQIPYQFKTAKSGEDFE
ncbi:hypothetical protein T03_12125 [Trichinella britovi]|uniref:Uncharacterized protein n=1 Tax=Trichinella britovi TaxID=45882 RepID=A0A0V1CMK0_TRIBR|nr:hypothetical protein T03_12125 [Trichinella britovi]